MRAISNWLDRFCYKHPKLGIPDLMKYIVLANAAVFVLDLFTNSFVSLLLCFHYNSIMHGQVWRLLTFILVPSIGGGGSEDISYMMNRVQQNGGLAVFFRTFTPCAAGAHNRHYDFDEKVLSTAVSVFSGAAAELMG